MPSKMILTLILLTLLALVPTEISASLYIHPDTDQCNTFGSSLKCDFGSTEENIVLNNLPEDGGTRTAITVIYIHNAKRVLIPKAFCVDMSFYNVELVHFSYTNVCQKKLISLRFSDSSVNQVPRQLSRLELTRSKVQSVNCDLGLQRLTVSSSEIDELNAPWPVAGAYTIRIEHSTIRKLTALNIENRVTMVVTNSTFESMPQESLTLGKGSVTIITKSFITTNADNAIVVKTGAKLSVRDTEGRIAVSGPQPGKDDEFEKRPPGVPVKVITVKPEEDDEPQDNPEEIKPRCKNDLSWVWFIPTVLATVEALVIIVQCGQKYPTKRKDSGGPDMENPGVNFRGPGYAPPPQDSSINFYSENTYQPILRRR